MKRAFAAIFVAVSAALVGAAPAMANWHWVP
jgi:hypothetical protein